MAEDLSNYKLQLEQVEAALTSDPENEDLLKLKNDLLEVIHLTEELVGQSHSPDSSHSPDTSSRSHASSAVADPLSVTRTWLSTDWKSGDRCRAPWSTDQHYYPATIDEILEDGTCAVIFEKYGSTEVTQVSLLRPLDAEDDEDDLASKKPKTKKDLSIAQREYKKKKAQKKAQRLKQMEDDREQDKNKWLQFNTKVFSKTTKGKVKKSIFATPDANSGRVGVGTCGVSGRPMTKFTHMEKWKK